MRKLPPRLGRFCKWIFIYPRYWIQKRNAKAGFREFGDRYRHPILFVAGMPKSGSTWLEQMLAAYPGYQEILLPEATFAELRGVDGHVFELPNNCLARFKQCLVLTKMHCPGLPGNVAELRAANVPCAILYRDPRDVAVSYYYYVRGTPWHDDYSVLKRKTPQEGISYFINKRLPEFALWMRSWRDNRDQDSSVMLSYEEMLENPESVLSSVFEVFRIGF